MLNTIAYSIKAWNLNGANPENGKEKGKDMILPKNITELVNRKGAIAAFNTGGYGLSENAFNNLYATAKNEASYTQKSYPNAFAAVSYYRSVGPNKPMNMTSTTGFNAVTLAHNSKNSLMKDNGMETLGKQMLIENLVTSPLEFAVFTQKVNAMLTAKNVDTTTFTPDMYEDLLNGKTVNNVTLTMEFFKAFNGPCVNEALVLNLLGLHLDKTTSSEETTGDIYIGSENTENYQRIHAVQVGVGTMIGKRQFENGPPVSNPGDNPTPTEGNGTPGDDVSGPGDDGTPTDDGTSQTGE